ncbi:MAG TPA: hypothetical protein VGI38_11845 [Puia sp.]|jgi:hypothetical protein
MKSFEKQHEEMMPFIADEPMKVYLGCNKKIACNEPTVIATIQPYDATKPG